MKSRLNCLLMSSSWTCEEDKYKLPLLEPAKPKKTEVQPTAETEEDENLWASLQVIHTKKLKRKPKHEKFETDINEIGMSKSKKHATKSSESSDSNLGSRKTKKLKKK